MEVEAESVERDDDDENRLLRLDVKEFNTLLLPDFVSFGLAGELSAEANENREIIGRAGLDAVDPVGVVTVGNSIGRDGAVVNDPLLQEDPTTLGFTTESSDTSNFLVRVGVIGVIKVNFIFAGTSDLIGASFSSQLAGNNDSVVSAVTTSVSVFVLFVKS